MKNVKNDAPPTSEPLAPFAPCTRAAEVGREAEAAADEIELELDDDDPR